MSSQNDTIALLLKQMDGYNLHRVTVAASGGALASASDSLVTAQQDKIKEELQVLRAQIKAISRNISELGASLGPTVESSVTNRLNVHGGGIASLADLKGASDDMRQLVLDVSQSLTHSLTSDRGDLVKRICCDALTTAYEKLSESVSSKVRTSHDMLRRLRSASFSVSVAKRASL